VADDIEVKLREALGMLPGAADNGEAEADEAAASEESK
jgi:hypothetical protein